MTIERYPLGRTPRGKLVHECCIECYRFLDPKIYERLKKHAWLYVERGEDSYEEWDGALDGFKPAFVPSLPAKWGEYSRWWVKDGIFVYDGELGAAYIRLSRIVISERYEVKEVAIEKPEEFKDYKRGGHLIDRELPVVRHKDRYLRVGYSIAWHRVLGLLDDGRWVLIGDGLYEAEFVPTAKNPLEDFGEVGYVKVLGPYAGSLDDVQSPCGAPRLVACTEEGRAVVGALLDYVRGVLARRGVASVDLFVPPFWICRRPFVIPELVELDIPNEVVAGWPLTNPCPSVLRFAAGDPLGLITPSTCHFCWD
ncbi:MAG: hypothetical protein QW680_09165 [Pyrobaculum sp.]|uniref:hypothetical protein n=1 Tax=Pyrobaculum sp. TaxID=2004705 RepID=UPI003163DC3A